MRQINFRAWDSINNEMCDNFQWYKYFAVVTGDPGENSKNRQYKLMQYTGLKDRLGKEIYEGDIVQMFNTPVEGQECKGSVWYMAPSWKIKEIGNNKSYDMASDFGYGETVDDLEVIGNIWEHPELLKEANASQS